MELKRRAWAFCPLNDWPKCCCANWQAGNKKNSVVRRMMPPSANRDWPKTHESHRTNALRIARIRSNAHARRYSVSKASGPKDGDHQTFGICAGGAASARQEAEPGNDGRVRRHDHQTPEEGGAGENRRARDFGGA